MALAPGKKAEIVWGEFSPHLQMPPKAGLVATPSPDGKVLSLTFSGLELRCGDPGTPKSASLALAGVQALTLPKALPWSGTLAVVRGAFNGNNGARGTLLAGIGGGVFSRVFSAPISGDDLSEDFSIPVFSPEGAVTVGGDAAVETTPLTLSLVLVAAAPGERASVILSVDSIDLSLWTG
ncbi:MAG: hypothetical protein U1E56_06380 [Bauldia sp.]